MEYFIEGNVPSKKNSKRLVTLKNGRRMQIASEASMHYVMATEWQYQEMGREWEWDVDPGERGVLVEMFFVRERNGRWDFNNISQMVADCMVHHGWIKDDDVDHLVIIPPLEGPRWKIDKEHPGVRIRFLKFLDKPVMVPGKKKKK